jgi:hypothetical protein
MREIFRFARGRPLNLRGEPASNRHYAAQFFAAAEARPGVDYSAPPIDCIFGESDNMTDSFRPRRDSIYVVRDQQRRMLIEQSGLPRGSAAISIADVLRKELEKYIVI